MRVTLMVGLVAAGLASACSDAGGVSVGATLDKSAIDPKTVAPIDHAAGITVVTRNWRESGVVDCVSQALAKTKPDLRVVPAKNFPSSIYRWDTYDIAELQRLTQQPAAAAEIAAGNVRYVAVVDVDTMTTDDTPTSPCTFTCGKRSEGTAKIWDIAAGSEVARATAVSSGRAVMPTPFFGPFLPLWFDPATETAVCEGLGQELAEYFARTIPPAAR
ncbi:MAG: hypothetical protein AB7S71_04700 [Dongiaceae bacterium]